jgi:hypothetical protein
MDRQTEEIVLPQSGAVVTLYQSLTFGDVRKIKRAALTGMKLKLDAQTNQTEVQEMDGSLVADMEELTMKCLIQKITTKEGTLVEDITGFIDNLTENDGNILFEKVNERSASSSLNKVQKKN